MFIMIVTHNSVRCFQDNLDDTFCLHIMVTISMYLERDTIINFVLFCS